MRLNQEIAVSSSVVTNRNSIAVILICFNTIAVSHQQPIGPEQQGHCRNRHGTAQNAIRRVQSNKANGNDLIYLSFHINPYTLCLFHKR